MKPHTTEKTETPAQIAEALRFATDKSRNVLLILSRDADAGLIVANATGAAPPWLKDVERIIGQAGEERPCDTSTSE